MPGARARAALGIPVAHRSVPGEQRADVGRRQHRGGGFRKADDRNAAGERLTHHGLARVLVALESRRDGGGPAADRQKLPRQLRMAAARPA